jgi:hypothetical protein
MGYPRHFLWDIKEDIGGYIYIYITAIKWGYEWGLLWRK